MSTTIVAILDIVDEQDWGDEPETTRYAVLSDAPIDADELRRHFDEEKGQRLDQFDHFGDYEEAVVDALTARGWKLEPWGEQIPRIEVSL